MLLSPEAVEAVCGYARIGGRGREVFSLLSEGLTVQEIAVRLEIAEGTVYWHVHRLKQKIGAAQSGFREVREFWETILHEAMPGGKSGSPPTPLYHTRGPWFGEQVRLNAGSPVTVDSMMEREGYGRPHVKEALAQPQKKRKVDTGAKKGQNGG